MTAKESYSDYAHPISQFNNIESGQTGMHPNNLPLKDCRMWRSRWECREWDRLPTPGCSNLRTHGTHPPGQRWSRTGTRWTPGSWEKKVRISVLSLVFISFHKFIFLPLFDISFWPAVYFPDLLVHFWLFAYYITEWFIVYALHPPETFVVQPLCSELLRFVDGVYKIINCIQLTKISDAHV